MKYQRTDKIQLADFSCLEELKCDIIENLLSLPKTDEVFNLIDIIVNKNKAFDLFKILFESDVNGFNFEIDEEFENEFNLDDLRNEDTLLITVCYDGKIWIDKANINYYCEAQFFYIDADVKAKWQTKFDDGYNEILIFDIDL